MKKFIAITALGVLAGTSTGWAADNAELEGKVEELTRQNQMLLERVVALEKILAGREPQEKGLVEKPDESDGMARVEQRVEQIENTLDGKRQKIADAEDKSLLQGIKDRVDLKGLIEVEAFAKEDFSGSSTSDISLATVEIGLDANISDWTQAHLLLLYEEGEENDHMIVDEALVTFGKPEEFPFYLTMGRMYLPFGSYVSNMVSDSLPLELGEINDTGVLAGFQESGLYGAVYAFNGDLRKAGGDDKIDAWGASLGFACEGESLTFDVALDWLNNIGDTDGLSDYLEDTIGLNEMDDYVEGVAAHILFQYAAFDFVAEYVTALDEFAPGEMFFSGSGARPSAWSVEAGLSVDWLDRETTFSLSCQGTDEALGLGLPETRYGAAIRMAVFANTTIALEYLHDTDYDEADGGTDKDADTATMQVAVKF